MIEHNAHRENSKELLHRAASAYKNVVKCNS